MKVEAERFGCKKKPSSWMFDEITGEKNVYKKTDEYAVMNLCHCTHFPFSYHFIRHLLQFFNIFQ